MVSGQVNLYFRKTKADWKLVTKVVNFWVSNVEMDQNQIIEPDTLNLKKENSTWAES